MPGPFLKIPQEVDAYLRKQYKAATLELRDVYDKLFDLHADVLALKEIIMSEQSQITAIAGSIQAVATALNAAVVNIEDEITALQSANPTLDLSALNAAVAALQTAASGVEAIPTGPTGGTGATGATGTTA